MTRQHIRFSALRSIFWGTLLLFLDFDLNFRFGFSFTLPLLPNCIGFWLVARGTRSLAANRPSLGLLGPFWLALGLWSLQQFFPGLSPHIPGALSLLAALVRMYADFQLFTDLALTMTYSLLASLIVALTLVPAMAAGLLRKEKPQKPGLLATVYPAYRTAVSWLTVAAGAAGFCARIYILLRLWQLSRAMAPAPEASI